MPKKTAKATPEAIISLIEKLTAKENTQLFCELLDRPDLRPGIMLVPEPLFRDMYLICKMVLEDKESMDMRIQGWKDAVDSLAKHLEKYYKCQQAKKEKTSNRNKEIKTAFEAGITKKNMYQFMKENFQELLPSRRGKKGTKEAFMAEEKMWESYRKNGGTIP